MRGLNRAYKTWEVLTLQSNLEGLSEALSPISKNMYACYIFSMVNWYLDVFYRFKLIFGYLQLDNQLPLTLMPVLLAPEQTYDVQHPVFKMTITIQNENKDGIQVYPYVYIRVCYVLILWYCSFLLIKFQIFKFYYLWSL